MADAADLQAIERDLAEVEAALARLDDGTYWNEPAVGDADATPVEPGADSPSTSGGG